MSRNDLQRDDLHRALRQIVWAWPHAQLDAESRGFGNGRGDGTGASTTSDPTSAAALAALDTRPGTLSDALIQARAEIWLKTWADLVRTICAYWHLPLPAWQPATVQTTIAGVVDNGGLRPSDRAAVYRLADQALAWWPPPPKVTMSKGGKVRIAEDDMCSLCGLPAPSGKDEKGRLLRRTMPDGRILHNTKPTTTDDDAQDERAQAQACYWIVYRQERGLTCAADGCERVVKSRGLCGTHWNEDSQKRVTS